MQNTIEKGMKIHPVGTLVAILACMFLFYICNFVLMKLSKNRDEILSKEVKQRVEEVTMVGQGVIESETVECERIEDLRATDKDIEKIRKEKMRAKTTIEPKQIPALIKT